MTWECWFREQERSFPGSQREQRSSSINSGTPESRSGAITSRQLKHWRERDCTSPPRWLPDCSSETASVRKSVQRDHQACGGARCPPGQDTEGCIGASHGSQSPARRKDIVFVGGVCGILNEQVRHRQGRKDTVAKTTRAKGQHTDPGTIRHMPAKPARGGKWEPQFHPGVFVGMLNSSSEAVIVTEQGLAIKTRSANIRRVPESERYDAEYSNAGQSQVPRWQ